MFQCFSNRNLNFLLFIVILFMHVYNSYIYLQHNLLYESHNAGAAFRPADVWL